MAREKGTEGYGMGEGAGVGEGGPAARNRSGCFLMAAIEAATASNEAKLPVSTGGP